MADKPPSAWEQVLNEPAAVSYWKWRVRRLESLLPGVALAAAVVGFGTAAILIRFVI